MRLRKSLGLKYRAIRKGQAELVLFLTSSMKN